MTLPPKSTSVVEHYAAESARIRARFEETGDGLAALKGRSELVDSVVLRLYRELISESLDAPKDFCVVALGGYGRSELFPSSDVDLLFLAAGGRIPSTLRD